MRMGKSKWLLLMLGVSILATSAENNQKKNGNTDAACYGGKKGNENRTK